MYMSDIVIYILLDGDRAYFLGGRQAAKEAYTPKLRRRKILLATGTKGP